MDPLVPRARSDDSNRLDRGESWWHRGYSSRIAGLEEANRLLQQKLQVSSEAGERLLALQEKHGAQILELQEKMASESVRQPALARDPDEDPVQSGDTVHTLSTDPDTLP